MLQDVAELAPVYLEVALLEAQPGKARHMGDVDVDGHGAIVVKAHVVLVAALGPSREPLAWAGMHVAPIVLIPHASGTDGWTGALATLADCLDRHTALVITVRAPGAALEHLAREEKDLWNGLDQDRIRWLAGGFSDPVLTSLPPAAAALQLERETVAMDTARVTPTGLWVGDAWEPGLVSLAARSALPLVFLDAALLGRPPDRPGPVERAGEAIIAVPVLGSRPDTWSDDGLAVVQVEPPDLEEFVTRHRGQLTTPDFYLSDHLPGERIAPPLAAPARPPEREAFYRQLLVLTRDQGDRRAGREALLRLQSREYLLEGAGSEAELMDARIALDRSLHRGDTWVEVRDLDWDADGLSEVWIGTPEHTLVLDPPEGTLEVWDDRSAGWAITSVTPALSGLLVRRLTGAGQEPAAPRLSVEGRTEGRSHASVTLVDPATGSCRVEATGRTVSIELSLSPGEPVRVGPEIPLNLEGARFRADGGAWIETHEPVGVTGHRFRFTDGKRTLLVSSPRPCEMFVRPLDGHGVVIWPHWMIRDGGTYRVALTPS